MGEQGSNTVVQNFNRNFITFNLERFCSLLLSKLPWATLNPFANDMPSNYKMVFDMLLE